MTRTLAPSLLVVLTPWRSRVASQNAIPGPGTERLSVEARGRVVPPRLTFLH